MKYSDVLDAGGIAKLLEESKDLDRAYAEAAAQDARNQRCPECGHAIYMRVVSAGDGCTTDQPCCGDCEWEGAPI